jgi:hypothetical protein
MVDDEVARALSRDSIYDMDSEDERWLIQLNHAYSNQNSSQREHTSYEDFEMIISIFEKDAYNNPKGIIDLGELISRYPALRKDDNVHAVYEYWTNKRSKRAAPLLRIFQVILGILYLFPSLVLLSPLSHLYCLALTISY